MGKRSHAWILIILILCGAAAFFLYLNQYLTRQKVNLTETVSRLKSEYTFARIYIQSKSGGRISFLIELKTPEGLTAAKTQNSLSGTDLYLESRVAVIKSIEGEKSFIFPTRLYTESVPPAQGLSLTPLYIENGLPLTYKTLADNALAEKSIKALYALSQKEEISDSDQDALGVKIILQMDAALHQTGAGYQAGKAYDCVVHPNGGMELKEAGK